MSNDHIYEALDEYVALPHPPQFAMLINGVWGIGKSHAVRKYTANLKTAGKRIMYVSLYGVSNHDDIDTMLLTATHALLDNSLGKFGARFAKAAFKKVNLGTEVKASDLLLPKGNIDLLVFDDLERTEIPINEVLAYINEFVEHDGMRVLIVCNEEAIKKQKKYRRIKEKVVGYSFDLRPQEREAFDAFVGQVTDDATRMFLGDHKEDVVRIFQQSQTGNLRLLSQSIWSWCRIYQRIEKPFREHSQGMQTLFRLFIALSIELRAGNLSKNDLSDRLDEIVRGQLEGNSGKVTPTPMSKAQDKYKEIQLHDPVLGDELLQQVLCEGRYDREQINRALSASCEFSLSVEEPAWRKVWYGQLRDVQEFDVAVATMEKQFNERVFTDEEEVLHVFGLRLFCGSIGQLDVSESEIVASCKAYVDHLFETGQLPVRDLDSHWQSNRTGLAYHGVKTEAFRELSDYCRGRCEEARKKEWPQQLSDLLKLMDTSPESLFAELCFTNDDRQNRFANVPIFSCCDADEFVTSLLKCKPMNQQTVFTALNARYQGGRLAGDLSNEADWLLDVQAALKANLQALHPIRKYYIEGVLERILAPLVKGSIDTPTVIASPTASLVVSGRNTQCECAKISSFNRKRTKEIYICQLARLPQM